jgi:3D (Asp-Asp-Asp) domain-containing protein
VRPREGVTVAADPRVWPMGACIDIAGLGRRVVQDVGGAIRGRRLDVFFARHVDALRFGRREMRVMECLQ